MFKNKGFTLIEILAVITIIGIIALLTVPVVDRVIQRTGNKVFQSNEKSLADAAEDYYMVNNTQLPPNISNRDIIFLNDLIANGYIKQIKDIKNRDNNCDGYVIIEKVKTNLYNYYPFLNCSERFITDGYYNTLPVIKVTGINPMNVLVNTTYTDLGATAIDITDGDITASITAQNNVNANTLGTYAVIYTVTNSLGKSSNVTRTVNVRSVLNDKNPPVITLAGNSQITIFKNTTYVDAGATAFDDVDGNLTSQIVTVNNVNTAVAGTYTVTYNVTDSFGNKATTVTRKVKVVNDTTAPIITLLGTTPITVIQNTTYTDAGATATDDQDGNLTSQIVTVNNVNIAVVGTYTVTYDVTDSSGNHATQVVRTVNVVAPPSPADYAYTGAMQAYTVPFSGIYKLEVWGAQGGGTTGCLGGLGGYSVGNITLTKDQVINIYVGQQGQNTTGGWNGGGNGSGTYGGGGATDIRISGTALTNRVIIAGGGGGGYSCAYAGGYGGGSAGGNAPWTSNGVTISGGSQSAGGTYGGTLGIGGNASSYNGGGGGGGYYGGGSNNGQMLNNCGAGGSGYIGTLTSAQTIAGNASMPVPAGGTETGHTGNGYARITFISQ
jgi:prepilin-type N-terminal cleavage/methylation domain-containing protein